MCGICNVVNCIRRNLFGCGYSRNNGCGYNRNNGCGCGRNTYYDNDSYREEPCMNVVCANRQNRNFTPCCDDDNCSCQRNRDCD